MSQENKTFERGDILVPLREDNKIYQFEAVEFLAINSLSPDSFVGVNLSDGTIVTDYVTDCFQLASDEWIDQNHTWLTRQKSNWRKQ